MTDQSNSAAERSAHVTRGAARASENILAEVAPGVFKLKPLVEAEREIERLREALASIAQWAEAYPEDIFPPVNIAAVRERFGDDALFSRLHGEWARHLTKGIGSIARAALEENRA